MAVTEETPIASSLANGVTTLFPHQFTVLSADDLVVEGTIGGVTTPYILGTNYSVNGVGASSGSVQFVVAPVTGTIVTRYRNTGLVRDTDYQNNGDLLAPAVNLDFDKLWLALQDIFGGGKSVPNTLRVPGGETVSALPAAANRAGRYLGFDGAGNVSLLTAASGTAMALGADLSDNTDALKGDALLAVRRTESGGVGTTLHTWMQRQPFTPEDFGALGNDSNDDTSGWQTALARCSAAGGGVVNGTPGKIYRITASLTLATNVEINLRGATVKQMTTNTPIFTAPSIDIQHWSIRNGVLEFSTQQTSSNTLGVGVRIANGALSYDWVLEDLKIDKACDGIFCGTASGTFAFIGRVENIISTRCAAWGINIACDTAAGANTNLVFTNCWSVQIPGAEIATSKGFRFSACSMSQWRSLYADHIQREFLSFTSCSGDWGVLSAESCDWNETAAALSLIAFADSFGTIESLLFTANNLTVSGSGEIYMARPTSSGAPFAMTVEHWVSSSNVYSGGANIYEVNPTANTAVYNKLAKLDRTVNLADFGVEKRVRQWNGVDRSISRGTTAQRPTLTADAIGKMYMDNTIDADGKVIWWNGTAWVDATGAVV